MKGLTIIRDYIFWHYSAALLDILFIWRNYLWFVNHLFSVWLLIKTYISPWKRMSEKKPNVFDLEDFLSAILVNIIMRMVGMLFRTILLGIALFFYIVIIVAGFAFIIFWIVLPPLIIKLFVSGTSLIFI